MNILELDSYNLADAVKFNEKLNPRIWQGDKMKPQVRAKLLQIAEDFKQSLGLSDLEVKDITVSGSNAGYTYTPNSDIDLHLVVDLPQADSSDVYRELFDAKKFQYNETHNITIGGYDVELYVENANEPPVSQGMYSVVNDDWINIPKKRRATVDDNAVKSKYDVMKHRIDRAIASKNFKTLSNAAAKIKKMRQAGLDKHGELGPENLAYKMLRTQGTIKALYDARTAAQDKKLSLKEQPKQRVTYGFREDVGITPDGVSPTTAMFLNETDDEQTVSDFIKDTAEFLGIKRMPSINLHSDADWGEQNHSFGRFDPETHELHVNLANRHIMDVLRTTAHELAHCKQHEVSELPQDAGETGSPWENEAHAVAGIVMRNYAEKHPEMFQGVDLNENASGYIPKNKKEARDPRYSMAVTVDIKPGQVGKEANKLALNTGKNGEPTLLMKSANLQESIAAEFAAFAEGKSYGYNSTPLSQVPGEREDELGNQEATGPEFPPQMPAGTTKIDVSDLTDWYRLGMDISDMDDADPADYNQGPPQTVVVFPSDEAEQGYLKQFKRLGLKTHDMDADVEGGEDVTGKHLRNKLAEELALFEEDLMEVKMTSKNLAKLAKDIKGATVGLEFEMIVPNVDKDETEIEPDYDRDETVNDIDDAINFFDHGDQNDRGTLRRLREEMLEKFDDWRIEQSDRAWDRDGYEFFQEYLDREEPFDPADYEDDAEQYVRDNNPDLDPDSEEFEELKSERLRELNAQYYVETWEMGGRVYDRAREEFDMDHDADWDQGEWLDDIGVRTMSDVETEFGHVNWPFWTGSNDDEPDTKQIALDFMNYMGMNSVAVGAYHGWGNGYEKWNGSSWVNIGKDKPNDCFTIEPDGSLSGDNDGDVGLEFVSPPIPLEDIGTVMKKVQGWAGEYGAYTGESNSTSLHTNISIPGYDLDKLDYLKAAILLGDEHVLRQFDRIGNSYAKPAIEKVKTLVRDKPEKAKELLDKMKSHLDAAASKLIHSGVTDKYTSINTKDNRIEYRSPGGDYLSDIADNPQKMIDTINRMVVNLDAAMDPNKYKEEYQKKLYKLLTGDLGSRTASTGDIKFNITSKATIWNKDTRRQEPAFKTTVDANTAKEAFDRASRTSALPADAKMSEYNVTPTSVSRSSSGADKDLIKYFSQYAAGELPKQALKSFVRQAQLQRQIARKEKEGRFWWNVKRNGQRIEVVARTELEAKMEAAREWGLISTTVNLDSMTAEVLRPYEEQPAQQQVGGIYKIYSDAGALIAGDEYGSDQAALDRGQYYARHRNQAMVVKNPDGQEIGRISNTGVVTPTAPTQQPAAQQPAARRVHRWEIVNNVTGDVVQVFTGGMEDEATNYAMDNYGHRFIFTTRPSDGEIQRVGNETPNWFIKSADTDEIVKAFHANDYNEAHDYLMQWKRDNNVADLNYQYGRVGSLATDVQRNILGNQPAAQQSAQPGSGEYGIWIQASERFARLPAGQANGNTNTLRTFSSREEAEEYLRATRANTVGMRNDIEVREIPVGYELPPALGRPVSPAFGGQEAPSSGQVYYVYNADTGRQYENVRSYNSDQEALEAAQAWAVLGSNIVVQNSQHQIVGRIEADTGEITPVAQDQFRSTGNVPREGQPRNLVPTGPGPWEIYRISNGESVRRLEHTNRAAAEEEARSALGLRGEAPELYGVRTQQSTLAATGGDAAQGGIIDVAGEQPATAPQTLTRPGQPQQQFTGEWKIVMPNGEEVYRFGGVGNAQADANRVAMDWLMRNRQYMQSGAEVLPVMG